MRKIIYPIMAVTSFVMGAANASAQQVVEMPSISTMIRQNIEESVPEKQNNGRENSDREDYDRQREKAAKAEIKAIEREKARQEKVAAEETRRQQKLEERRHKEMVKAMRGSYKAKPFKPLKKVRRLPPNSTNY